MSEIERIKKESAIRMLEHIIKQAYDDGYREGKFGDRNSSDVEYLNDNANQVLDAMIKK